ncbi:MAG: Stk1 family PASTA domain-containing Ser/Thr kinase [Clostridiales bacterium]|nr:Stk1 family PASTA domain-containing Ser/Thr kinase [Clostridiales bacterium]
MTMVKAGYFINERYEIIAIIGSGGTADVYKAKDHRLNRFVAIKILKQNYIGDSKIVAKFRQEAQACAGLTHPNIVSVFDVGNDGDLHYIVMELIEGITLKKFIEKKGKLEVKEAVGIAIQIAQGLDAAHANHIVHRDIKPQNIIISREGKVKVTDFGIARATFKTSTNTINQAPVGSVHYLSPEQARGGFSDERSDIYSLGVTIYEMLSGKVPFSGENNVSVALLHIQGEATPLCELNDAVTPSVEKIVAKCMQKRPERRYFSAAELIRDLKAAIVNPTGDFVKMGMAVNDAPTINMTADELSEIKNNAHSDSILDEDYEAEDEPDDDDDFDEVNSKTEKIVIIATIAVILLFLGVIVYFVISKFDLIGSSSTNTGKEQTLKLSNADISKLLARDLTLDELKKILNEEYNITTFSTRFTTSNSFEENHVMNISYESDILLIEVSQGPEQIRTVRMISVVGLSAQDAREKLKNEVSQDLKIEFVENSDYTSDSFNTILKQSIEEGELIPYDSEITLTYSKGPLTLQVPNINSYTKQMVETQYSDSFTLKFEYDMENDYSTDKSDIVVRTSPEANSPINKGDTLIVYLSPSIIKVPEVRGKTEEEATALLKGKSFKVTVVEVYDAEIEKGKVVSQSLAADSSVDRGASITINVSKGVEPTPEPTKEPTPVPTKETTPEVTVQPDEPTPSLAPPEEETPLEN